MGAVSAVLGQAGNGQFEYEDNNNLVVNFKIKDSENHGGGD